MIAIVTDWRSELIKAYRGFFSSSPGGPETRGCISCGDGWRDLLKRAFAKIEAIVGEGGSFTALQIKEKDGTLRLYWRGRLSDEAEAKVNEAIDLAQARSACTCSECGDKGQLYRSGGSLLTRCAVHAVGRLVEIKPDFENIHIVYRTVPGGIRVVTCSRYDRATDTFVDVLPNYLTIGGKLDGAFSLPSPRRGRDFRPQQQLARLAEHRLHHRDLRRKS
jgi:hypothetical protein